MPKKVTRHRVHVKKGSKYAGCTGWAYCTEDQDLWKKVTVKLDKVMVPDSEAPGMDAVTWNTNWAFLDSSASEGMRVVHGLLVRLDRWELRFLSELEALAEVMQLPDEERVTPKRLK